MCLFTFLSVACALFFEAAAVDCPSGWLAHGNTCYHFSHDKETWRDGRMICQDFGGDLAEIPSQDVDLFLQHEIDRLREGDFWVGGNDLEEEGIWKWAPSGVKVAATYVNWVGGNPDNSHSDENCMEMWPGRHGWNDEACSSVQHYICSKDPGVEPEVVG